MKLMKRPSKIPNPKKSDMPISGPDINVFAALDLPRAEEKFAKAQLAFRIHMLIKKLGLTQTAAAKILHTDRTSVSNLMRGRLREFSIERLFRFLNLLGQDVDVSIRPKRLKRAQVHILAKAG
jgi:predicted XRE-type DNA-binding protein